MTIVVLLKMVPDIVEELEVAPEGKSLATDFLRLILSERDSHALEEALLLKEKFGGQVSVVAPEAPEVDDVLYTALAKGADRVLKLTGLPPGLTTAATAALLAQVLPTIPHLLPADLILTGCQATDDLDGMLAPLLARRLERPYLGIVNRIELDPGGSQVVVTKEYPSGVHGQFAVPLPALFGIQAAEKPPRYVPVAKVRAVMKSQAIEEVNVNEGSPFSTLQVVRMTKPEPTGRAEMLEGTPEEVAGKLLDILTARALV